jgi:four helix bundle protein
MSKPIMSFRDLDTWQISMNLVDAVFAAVKQMPRIEFDLRRQMTKAATSIPSNIAEGWKRKRRRGAYQNHVSIAMGSHAELETQFEICFRNNFLDRTRCNVAWSLLNRVGPLLEKLHDSLD